MNLRKFYETVPEPYRTELLHSIQYNWDSNRMDHQIVPTTSHVHGIIAGRGAGKTRAGSEWVREQAQAPNTKGLIVVPNADMALLVAQVIQDCCPPTDRPIYWPSTGQLAWPNGSQTVIVTSDRGSNGRLRGTQWHYAWAEEPAHWYNNQDYDLWDDILLAVRLGIHPQILVTGTPATDAVSSWLQQAMKDSSPDVTVRLSSSYDNTWIDENYLKRVATTYKGTLLENTNLWGHFPE